MTDWTPASDAELSRLISEGKSSVDICREMARSRHAVCGRAKRLGLKFRAVPKPPPAWIEEARKLMASGLSLKASAEALGKSETTLRVGLDINGAKARAMESSRLAKARERARIRAEDQTAYISRQSARLVRNAEKSVVSSYTKPDPVKRGISLPKISLPDIPQPAKTLRFVPKVRVSEAPGVARWRNAHLAMVRAGKFRSADMVSEWQQ